MHGNAVALEAVLRELDGEQPDVVVFGGDLTWGPLPAETRALVAPLEPKAIFVSGNADRAVLETTARVEAGDTDGLRPRELWMVERHRGSLRAFLASFVPQAVVDVAGLGPVRFCHGSPRSDEEIVTYATPEPRMRALLEGVPERVLVTAHTHIQFDRRVVGIRSVNAGSVGMPYEGRAGAAFWALLGPDVELRRTDYDLDEAVRSYRATDDPLAEQMVEMLVTPASPAEVVEHGEALEFSG